MRRFTLFTAAALAAGAPAAPVSTELVTRYLAAELGGVTSIVRYAVARPDRKQVRYVFLSATDPRALPQEAAVLGPDGVAVQLSDEDGADCTLAHVEIMVGRKPAVVSAVRVFSPKLEDNDQSEPAVMDIQTYRPVPGGDAGEPTVGLRARGPPGRSRPQGALADVRRAILTHAAGR